MAQRPFRTKKAAPHRRPRRAGARPAGPRATPRMDAFNLAAGIAREAEASGEPADRLLRARLKAAHLPPEAAALVAHATFAWFRWRGFSRGGSPDGRAVAAALDMAARFARSPDSFEAAALAENAVPGWLAGEMSVSEAFLRALQAEPALWLRARPGSAAGLAAELPGARVGAVRGIADAVRYTGEQDLFRSAAFQAGRFQIQDVASQAVGLVCAPQPGETWWDACAGEGGKTLHLADQMQNRGVVWASDRSAARLAVLRKRAGRAGLFNIRVAPWTGGPRPPMRTLFDGVLLDAPCSGIGTWGRNPHARWTTRAEDVRELAPVQQQLLAAAALAVKPGGRLVYAVCTLTRAETADVAEAFARTHPDFAPAPFADPFAQPASAPAGAVLWEPQLSGGNGMFVAAWRRISR